jgi:hypothetical protein
MLAWASSFAPILQRPLETAILEIKTRIQSGTSRAPARGAEHHRLFHFHSPFVWRPNYAAISSVLTALLFAASGTAAQPTSTPSGRTWQSDGSAVNVQKIHDRQASDGDTITVPTGTFSWTNKIFLTKAVTLQGNTTTDSTTGNCVDNTIILDNIPRGSGGGLINLGGNGGQRITGLTFQPGLPQMAFHGIICVTSGTTPDRIDHCHFHGIYRSPKIGVFCQNWGVIDHNVLDKQIANEGLVHFWPAARTDLGDSLFQTSAGFGTANFLFVEDNYMHGGCDIHAGGKICGRYNKLFNANFGAHGTGRTHHDGRGGRAYELYNNEYHFTASRTLDGADSGTIIMHDNVVYDHNASGIGLQVYRTFTSTGSPFHGADGANAWDYNVTESDGTHVDGHPPYVFDSGTWEAAGGSTLTDNDKHWTTNQWVGYSVRRPSDGAVSSIAANTDKVLTIHTVYSQGWAAGNAYEIHKVLRVLDQPGLGAGNAINRASPAWPNQVTEPCYSWNNINHNDSSHFNFTPSRGGGFTIVAGRDYFNDTPMPGYTPYTYPHPLTTSLSPPQPSAGVKLGSRHHFYKKEKNEAKKARRKKWGHAKENLANEMAQPNQ